MLDATCCNLHAFKSANVGETLAGLSECQLQNKTFDALCVKYHVWQFNIEFFTFHLLANGETSPFPLQETEVKKKKTN